jgi:hypothetical protein
MNSYTINETITIISEDDIVLNDNIYFDNSILICHSNTLNIFGIVFTVSEYQIQKKKTF